MYLVTLITGSNAQWVWFNHRPSAGSCGVKEDFNMCFQLLNIISVLQSRHDVWTRAHMDENQGTETLPEWIKGIFYDRLSIKSLWKLRTNRRRRRAKWIFLHIKFMLRLRLEKLPFNLSGFKKEIINRSSAHCRLLKNIITIKLFTKLSISMKASSCCQRLDWFSFCSVSDFIM